MLLIMEVGVWWDVKVVGFSLTPITSGGDSAMPSMVPLMLLLGYSKLSGVPRRAVVNMRMSPIPTDFYQH